MIVEIKISIKSQSIPIVKGFDSISLYSGKPVARKIEVAIISMPKKPSLVFLLKIKLDKAKPKEVTSTIRKIHLI